MPAESVAADPRVALRRHGQLPLRRCHLWCAPPVRSGPLAGLVAYAPRRGRDGAARTAPGLPTSLSPPPAAGPERAGGQVGWTPAFGEGSTVMPQFLFPPRVPVFGVDGRVYGEQYWRERDIAFARSNGICQFCGLRPAVEAHHWSLVYPSDAEVTADHLTALCPRCHWKATLTRVLDRAGDSSAWFVLATASHPVPPPSGGEPAGRRRSAPRRGARSCADSERSASPHRVSGTRGPALRALVERCHLTLFAGCLSCRRFVRLDSLSHFRKGWRGSVGDLRRGLYCCRCRSRTRWVLLGGWPPAGTEGSCRDAGNRRAKRRHGRDGR